jgi:hypothetical protein
VFPVPSSLEQGVIGWLYETTGEDNEAQGRAGHAQAQRQMHDVSSRGCASPFSKIETIE